MKRVTPSSKLSAIWYVTRSPLPLTILDVVDVDHVMDVVVLEDDLLVLDQRHGSPGGDGVEGRPEVGVDVLIPVVQGQPVESHIDRIGGLIDDLNVADVVTGP